MEAEILNHFDRQLALLEDKANSLLSRPLHVLIDPQWATNPYNGEFLPAEVARIVKTIQCHCNVSIPLPTRPKWNTSDTGPGIGRQQLRELSGDIAFVRNEIVARG